MTRPALSRVVKNILSILFIVAVFAFMARSLYRSYHQIPFAHLHFEIIPLLGSLVMLGVSYAVITFSWVFVLGRLGAPLPLRRAFWIVAFSMLAKYVPGFIWSTVGRVYLAAKQGVREGVSVLSAVIENGLVLGSAAVVILLALVVSPHHRTPTIYLLLLIIPVVLVFLHPRVAGPLANWVLARLRQPPVAYRLTYGASLLLLLVFTVMVWLSQGLAFYLLIASLYPVGFEHFPTLLWIYVVSFLLGYFSPIPGGLGVREGSFAVLLPMLMPTPLAVAVGFLSRIWATTFELASAGVTFLIHRFGLTHRA